MVVEFLAEELRRDRERALWLYRRNRDMNSDFL